MTIYLGISQRDLSEITGEAYGCVSRKEILSSNDLFLVYVKRKGISQIYSVETSKLGEEKLDCEMRGMKTTWLKHLITLDKSLTIEMMKANEQIKNLDAVKKNFQMTTTIVNGEIFNAIIEHIVALNPNQEIKLVSILEYGKGK